jgi:Gnt-I system low-affinity gluconate transporter
VLKIHAFIALLISSIEVGLLAELSPIEMMDTVKNGMSSTLGFVATVVGLGAIFGGILEHSGGAKSITNRLLSVFGDKNAPTAMVVAGFIIAIPVFFDVAFIILVPLVYSLQKKTGKSLLLYAIPLLAGLAITHAYIPPTPGPIAVADLVGAKLGNVIMLGFIVGIPTALVSGLLFGRYIAGRIHLVAPNADQSNESTQVNDDSELPAFSTILLIIMTPIVFILLSTMTDSGLIPIDKSGQLFGIIQLIGHPFTALIIANILAWGILGIARGFTRDQLLDISTDSLKPAGTIILLTGAGGVFKQVLVDTEIGEQMALMITDSGIPILLFAFLAAVIVRVLQGSATVAMITAAGIVSTIMSPEMTSMQIAAIVLAIASGASTLSHFNDSGYWLIKEYLGMSDTQTLRSWTTMTAILSLTGFAPISIIYLFL